MFLRFAFFVLGIALAAASVADAQEKPRIEIVPQLGHRSLIEAIAIAPDGKTALSGSYDHTLRLWDLASGREIRKIEGYSDPFWSVAFAPDGKTALSGSAWADTLRLWDLATGREIRKFKGHSDSVPSVAISPDGKTALSGGRQDGEALGPGQRP